jgi:hypothetical protein
MRRLPHFLWVPFGCGAGFAGMFVFGWGAFLVGKMDTGGVVFITAVQVFTLPLLIGSILLMRKRRSGFTWLKIGSICFIAEPFHLWKFWCLEYDPEVQAWLSSPSGDRFR